MGRRSAAERAARRALAQAWGRARSCDEPDQEVLIAGRLLHSNADLVGPAGWTLLAAQTGALPTGSQRRLRACVAMDRLLAPATITAR
jgi:hypothetical protein